MQNGIIDSPFILEEIKVTPWKKRDYINDLLQIQSFIINGATGVAGHRVFGMLKGEYPKQYLTLLKETSIERFQLELVRQAEKRQEQLNREKEQKAKKALDAAAELEKYKKWLANGGMPR